MTKPPATISHLDIYGRRNDKYETLETLSVQDAKWTELAPVEPYYFFVPKDFSENDEYQKGFKIDELFPVWNAGVKTDRDELFIDKNKDELGIRIMRLLSGNLDEQFITKFNVQNSGSYKIIERIKFKEFDEKFLQQVEYRPFDRRWIYYDKTIISRPAEKVTKHFLRNNYAFICGRQTKGEGINHYFLSRHISEMKTAESTTGSYQFPLYLYSDSENLDNQTRTPNLDGDIVAKIAAHLGMIFRSQEEKQKQIDLENTDTSRYHKDGESAIQKSGDETLEIRSSEKMFTPEDILDYIYAILHSPSYREKYKEFLKIDFPRVPYPQDIVSSLDVSVVEIRKTFKKLVALGGELRALHLLESSQVEDFITSYPVAGDNVVENVKYIPDEVRHPELVSGSMNAEINSAGRGIGKIFINATQYFGGVPESVWVHPIGGYMPAQKWLKDRKGRTLTNDDIMHYQRMIVALSETARVMEEVDKVIKI